MVGPTKKNVGVSGSPLGMSRIAVLALVSVGVVHAESLYQDVVVNPRHAKGRATFVTGADRGTIPLALPDGRTTAEPMDFLRQYGHLFGVSDPSKELTGKKIEVGNLGQTHTTYQQLYAGVPVFGAILKVHQDLSKNVIAANGHFFSIPKWLNPTPTLSPDAAAAAARAEIDSGQLAVERNELVVVDPSWYGDPPIGVHLAYYVIVADQPAFIREAFFVDAHTGRILDQWTLMDTALHREVYFGLNTMELRAVKARFEGEAPVADNDANRAYDYTGDFYDFFFRMFDRRGLQDSAYTFVMVATVHHDALPANPPTICPNAYWNGHETAFCTQVAQDDVVGHEWGHALTDNTAGLIYQNQPGQLNESYSDVWGELIDLFNGNAGFPGTPTGPDWPVPVDYFGPGTDTPNNIRPTGQCSSSPRIILTACAGF